MLPTSIYIHFIYIYFNIFSEGPNIILLHYPGLNILNQKANIASFPLIEICCYPVCSY